MVIFSTDDDKTKVVKKKEQQAEMLLDSALMVGDHNLKKFNQTSGEDVSWTGVQQGSKAEPQPVVSQDNPFSSSMATMMPTVTDGKTTVPSYNVNDVFKTRMESTQAPVRDAAQDERLKKMSKFNLIAKGLQSVFGGIIGAQGEIVPSPYDGGMTQQLMQNLQGLDDKHFREMAAWRDSELKGQMFNANQQAQADQVRLQKMRDDVQNLKDQGRYDDAMKRQAGLDEYEKQQDAKNYTLKKNDQNISNRRLNAQESDDQVRVVQQYTASVNSLQNELKAMKEDLDTDPADLAVKQSELDQLTSTRNTLAKQLAENKGFTFEEPKSGGDNSGLSQRLNGVIDKVVSGGYKTKEDAAKEMADVYKGLYNLSDADAFDKASQHIEESGYFGGSNQSSQQAEPNEADYPNKLAYRAAKVDFDEAQKNSAPAKKEQAKSDLIKAKDSDVMNKFDDALSMIEDPGFVKQAISKYQNESQRESAINSTISKLSLRKDELEKKQKSRGWLEHKEESELLSLGASITGLKKSVEEYKKTKATHGK